MLKENENGAVSGLTISFIFAIFLLILAIVFGAWAYSSRQDYKDNVDAKIKTAVKVAQQKEDSVKDAQFAQEEKNPLRTYTGPEAYGSLTTQYPKTWSAYVTGQNGTAGGSSSGPLLDGYFYPGVVPSVGGSGSVFALRFEVIGQPYSQTVSQLAGLAQSKTPPVVTAYALPKLPNVIGVKVVGTLPSSTSSNNPKTGTMIILPLRSQTLEVWTEGSRFLDDFNNIILPNLTFSP